MRQHLLSFIMLYRQNFKHLAFTGTKQGITDRQSSRLLGTFPQLRDKGYLWMHNGSCIGADAEAAILWRKKLKGKIQLHPPINTSCMAKVEADIYCEPKDYIVRDQHMVDCSRILVATPLTKEEEIRSGTWTTVRYARKLRLKILIIHRDGTLIEN